MNVLWRIVALLLAGLYSAAAVAGSLTVSPAGPFSASGELDLGKGIVPVSCLTTFVGSVTADGTIRVDTLTFEGGILCRRIGALGLPWSGTVDSEGGITLRGMQVNIRAPLLGGTCGPQDVPVSWSNEESSAHFGKVRLPPDCRVDGTLYTTQRFTVTAQP